MLMRLLLPIFLLIVCPAFVGAQGTSQTDRTQTEAAAGEDPTASEDTLFTQAELENLVAPVALYPDTLLIQILVASTEPMQVVKADRLLAVNAEEDPEVTKTAIEAEEWDESVEVLAVAFPEVVEDMALHIEWTETMGDAMLAQTDEVMVAVQTMRDQAVNAGTLVSTDAQEVEVTEEEEIIVTPTDPEVVYVPQYDPDVVYVDNSNLLGDAFTAGLITYTTFSLIDAIFDDDDDWDDYWGCRNCAGWGGGPIYRNPDIDIDVDGNVNIGNQVDLGDRDIDISNRRPEDGWRADDRKREGARDKITAKRDNRGSTKLPVNKSDSRSDALRSKLATQSGAPDISRPEFANKPEAVRNTMGDRQLPKINRPNGGGFERPSAGTVNRPNIDAANRPKASKAMSQGTSKPAVKKPAANKAPVKKATKVASPKPKPKAIKKHSSGNKARKASSRGKKAGGKLKKRKG